MDRNDSKSGSDFIQGIRGSCATSIFNDKIELRMPFDSTAVSFYSTGISLGTGGSSNPALNTLAGAFYDNTEVFNNVIYVPDGLNAAFVRALEAMAAAGTYPFEDYFN